MTSDATLTPDAPPSPGGAHRGFPREVVDRVWQLTLAVEGNDPAVWRKDEFGAWINRLDYGNRNSDFGWEIADPPVGAPDLGVASLRAMQWQNYLDQVAASSHSRISADGLRNARYLF